MSRRVTIRNSNDQASLRLMEILTVRNSNDQVSEWVCQRTGVRWEKMGFRLLALGFGFGKRQDEKEKRMEKGVGRRSKSIVQSS